MKRILIIALCLLLALPTVLPVLASTDEAEDGSNIEKSGKVSGKDEVIYGVLSATGEEKEFYIVNRLDVLEEGRIVDYGTYHSLKNLTNMAELAQSGDKVEFTAPEGTFYYQGNLESVQLPWKFSIQYFLDGKEVEPSKLAGETGDLEIRIQTEKSDWEEKSPFYENYLLQISLELDSDKTRNIVTEDGMLANAGKNVQVTFTVLPEEEAELTVSADVEDFELSSIDIAAVPQNMALDAPDTDEFTEDIKTLSEALQELDAGVLELKNGTEELHRGTSILREGSLEYRDGITTLNQGSEELVDGSKTIADALKQMNDALQMSEMEDVDLSDLEQVVGGLSELSKALREMEGGLRSLDEGYHQAYQALDDAMNKVPHTVLDEQEIGALYLSGADQETIEKLLSFYEYALTVKGTYDHVKEAFEAVEGTLPQMANGLGEMAQGIEEQIQGFSAMIDRFDLSDLTNGIQELQQGLAQLSTNYNKFHSGLVKYTDGVNQLSDGYSELDSGIAGLEDGTKGLTDGIGELRDGTRKLANATEDMPEQVTEEIDNLLNQYDKSDFTPVSFISEKNNDLIRTVQFVLKTEPIEIEEVTEEESKEEESKSFWQRFLDLFRK